MQDKGKCVLEAGHGFNNRTNIPGLPPQQHTMVEHLSHTMTVVNSSTMMNNNNNNHHGSSSNTSIPTRSLGGSLLPRSRTFKKTKQRNTQILKFTEAVEIELKQALESNPGVDIKKLRRTVSNRLSAQRARHGRSTKINELKTMISELEDSIHVRSSEIALYQDMNNKLQLENNPLKQKLDAYTVQAELSTIELEKNMSEVKRLREMLAHTEQPQEMMNKMQGESFFGRFQNAVLDASNFNLDDFNEMELDFDFSIFGDDDDQFPPNYSHDQNNIQQHPNGHFPF